ncbi:MAG: alpha/beta fold hydrolase [Chloroflexales bacterium]|nr:alpha/beta fold hydrolase [Chloroflexales bacterium]
MKKAKFKIARTSNNLGTFKDAEMDWFFKRTLEYANSGGADIGDCLSVVDKIDERNLETWIDAWEALGRRVETEAETSLKGGHIISARDAYLRASNYYRAAEYAALPTHPKFHDLWKRSRDCFHKACPLFEPAIQILDVPFEGKRLPAYFWSPDDSGEKRPTMFSVGGNDSSGEEVWYWSAQAAVDRGYNFFTFEFPGHRGTVHLYPDCVKRYDMEAPFSAAFDVLEKLPGVDERIALAGHSFGGYVVSRVAIYEKRVKALIPSTPLTYPLGAQKEMLEKTMLPRGILAWLTEQKLRRSPLAKSMLLLAMWNSGNGHEYSARAMIDAVFEQEASKWDLRDKMHQITCPTLALAGENEGKLLIDQTREFYEKISSSKKDLYIFTLQEDGSDDHCQLDNRTVANRVIFDWLDDLFK